MTRERLFTPRITPITATSLLLLLSAFGTANVAQAQSFTELSSTLTNGNSLDLFDQSRVSSTGSQVVGTEYTLNAAGTAVTSAQAVTLTGTSTTPTELGYLAGDAYSYGFGNSADGSTVVGASVGTVSQATRWNGGTVTGLGTLSGYTNSVAYGTSNDGSVVTGVASNPTTGASEVFRWTSAGGMTTLGALPGGYTDSSFGPAYSNTISSNGSAIAGDLSSATGAQPTQSFLWTASSGTVTALGVQTGGTYSITAAISQDGTSVVGYGDDANGNQEAYRWHGGTMTALGLAYGSFQTNATGTSGDASLIVGDYFHNAANGTTDYSSAYVYSSSYGYADLEDYAQNSLHLTSAFVGWSGIDAFGISSDGTTIVGDGYDASGNYAYWKINSSTGYTAPYTESSSLAATLGMVTGTAATPEPGALALLAPLSLPLLLGIQRRKQAVHGQR